MKIIPRHIHAVLDYIVGVLLLAAPWLLGFSGNQPATIVACVMGAGALLYSLLTKYEAGVIPIIPFRMHLILDIFSGAFLAASPWIFGFADTVYLPHLIVGLFEIGAGLMTRDTSEPVLAKR